MKFTILVFIFITTVSSAAQVTNHETKGNLESPNPTKCVKIANLTNQHNPADIFVGISKCLSSKNYKFASKLYMTAIAYGRYDTMRVKDKSAHQAISVLRMNTFSQLEEGQINELQAAMKIVSDDKTTCDSIIKLGSPEYHPNYMLQHGMSAFTGEGGGLVEDFKASEAWHKVIKDYLKCAI
jgi:hypothetical protein